METSPPRRHLAASARRAVLAGSLAAFAGLTGFVAAGGAPSDSPRAAASPGATGRGSAAPTLATTPTTEAPEPGWWVPAQPPTVRGGWGPPQGVSRGS